MSKKTFNLIKGCVVGAQAIAIAVVTYCCDTAVAASVNASVIIIANAAIEVCGNFVKEE